MSNELEIMIRTSFAFISLWLYLSLLGKQSIGLRTNHGFITSVILGTIAGNMAFNINIEFKLFLLSLFILSVIAYASMVIALRSQRSRKWIVGQPTVLIEDGKILEENMRKIKYTLDTLNHSLREKGIFDIHEVQYAVLEVNGQLSVLKKPEYRPVLKHDLTPIIGKVHFPVELIMDGQVMKKNMENNRISQEWLDKELEKRGLQIQDVFYAVKGTKGQLFFDLYYDKISRPLDRE